MTAPFLAPNRDAAFHMPRASSGTPYYTLFNGSATFPTTLALTINRIHYTPVFVDAPVVIDQIACEVTTNESGKNCRFGLYRADRDDQPTGAPLLDSGDVSITTAGVKTYTPATPLYLPRGGYLQAVNTDATAGVLRAWRGLRGNPVASDLSTTTILFLYNAQTYGALPTPGTAWNAVTSGTNAAWYHPFVFRVSAP